jgi:hypothetical protein
MKLLFFIKLFLVRAWININGPIIEIRMEDAYERMADPISSHRFLSLFEMSEADSAAYYQKCNKELYQNQQSEWLKKFIGKSKKILYWVTPWGGCVKDYSKKERLTIEYSIKYIRELKKINNSIAKKGYLPEKYGYITGELLLNEKGEKRFIIWNGYRRILSLAHLGYKKIKVEISGGNRWEGNLKNHTIKKADYKRWLNVKNKLYTKEEALQFFNRFFE